MIVGAALPMLISSATTNCFRQRIPADNDVVRAAYDEHRSTRMQHGRQGCAWRIRITDIHVHTRSHTRTLALGLDAWRVQIAVVLTHHIPAHFPYSRSSICSVRTCACATHAVESIYDYVYRGEIWLLPFRITCTFRTCPLRLQKRRENVHALLTLTCHNSAPNSDGHAHIVCNSPI